MENISQNYPPNGQKRGAFVHWLPCSIDQGFPDGINFHTLPVCAHVSAKVSHAATVPEKPWQNVRGPGCTGGQVAAGAPVCRWLLQQ